MEGVIGLDAIYYLKKNTQLLFGINSFDFSLINFFFQSELKYIYI